MYIAHFLKDIQNVPRGRLPRESSRRSHFIAVSGKVKVPLREYFPYPRKAATYMQNGPEPPFTAVPTRSSNTCVLSTRSI